MVAAGSLADDYSGLIVAVEQTGSLAWLHSSAFLQLVLITVLQQLLSNGLQQHLAYSCSSFWCEVAAALGLLLRSWQLRRDRQPGSKSMNSTAPFVLLGTCVHKSKSCV
jgi:uncharacterized protein YqcC (DUF446 family)